MKKKWFLIVIIIAIFGVGIFFYNKKNIYINIVLSQSSYNYLPKEAKNYIKEVYNHAEAMDPSFHHSGHPANGVRSRHCGAAGGLPADHFQYR